MIDLDAEPEALYRQVVALDHDGFKALMAEAEPRDKVIDALVVHFAGRLRPDKAADVEAVIHIKLWDRPGGGYDHRELVIDHGTCVASHTPTHEPRLTLKIRPEDLRAIVAGDTGPKRLAFRRRLSVIGDIPFGMKLTEYFDLTT